MATLSTSVNNPPLPDLELLPSYALFALVVRRQSMSQAARETGLTRSAVSQKLQRLEAALGTVLLRRTTRRVSPTEAGAALLASCSRLLEDLEGIRASVQDVDTRPLRINGPANLLRGPVGALLRDFVDREPGAVQLFVESRHVDLLESPADVVLRAARRIPPHAVARSLAVDRFVVAASPQYLSRAGVPLTPLDLTRHECLRYALSRLDDEWKFRVDGQEVVIPVRPTWAADDGEVLVQLAVAGRGLIVVPSFMVAEQVEQGALQVVLEGFREDTLTFWAVLPEGRQAPRRARALAWFLGSRLGSHLRTLPPAAPPAR